MKKTRDFLDPSSLTRVIAIMTTGRAGSGLMSSLLDNHPCIVSTPDCLLSRFDLFWGSNCDLPGAKLTEAFIDYYPILFDGAKGSKCPTISNNLSSELNFTRMGESRDQTLHADVSVFRQSMRNYLPKIKCVTRRKFFQCLHLAYAESIGQKLSGEPIIAYGLHMPRLDLIKSLTEDFPGSKFIHMVRDPVRMAASSFRHYRASNWIDLNMVADFVARSCHSGEPLPNESYQNWRTVRLEDLHEQPKKTLTAICGWLDIPWHDRLLESTFNGLKYWNVKGSIQTSGFNKDIVDYAFDDIVTPFDRWRLGWLYEDRYFELGYHSTHGRLFRKLRKLSILPFFILPLKMELLMLRLLGHTSNPLGVLKAYFSLRKNIVHFVIYSPPCAPKIW